MKKRFLLLALLFPLMLSGCGAETPANHENIDHTRRTGEIGAFSLTSPANGFSTGEGFTFEWEEASNADYYQLELASTMNFISDDEDEVYVRESNISINKFDSLV